MNEPPVNAAIDDSKPGRVAKMLFHLGRGMWKSIPVLGPIVDEVVYEQFKPQLLGEIEGLTDRQLDAILARLPATADFDELEKKMEDLSFDERLLAMENHAESMRSISDVHREMQQGFTSVTDLIDELRADFSKSDQLSDVLERIETRRREWVSRISENQRRLLDAIPTTYSPLESLWDLAQRIVPDCSYKEFRFRLHELEWLGLVERQRENDSWRYRRREEPVV